MRRISTEPRPATIGYRPGLDGLRALAVAAVDPLPRRRFVGPRGIPGRRRVLRVERVPHHVTAARGAPGDGPRRPPLLLGPPGAPPAPRIAPRARRGRGVRGGSARSRPSSGASGATASRACSTSRTGSSSSTARRTSRLSAHRRRSRTRGHSRSRSSGTCSGRSRCSRCCGCSARTCAGRGRDPRPRARFRGAHGDPVPSRDRPVARLLRDRHPGAGTAHRGRARRVDLG